VLSKCLAEWAIDFVKVINYHIIMNRKEQIINLRNSGKPFNYIGKIFHISRQRVHQIYSGYNTVDQKISKALKEDKCEVCFSKGNLDLHHIDGNPKNNDKTNLLTACKKCHAKLDEISREARGVKRIFFTEKVVEVITKVCRRCGKEFTDKEYKIRNRIHCSNKCRKKTKEEKMERNRVNARRFYQRNKDNPIFKHKVSEKNKRQVERRKRLKHNIDIL